MRVEKWREDAQPEELEDATAREELPDGGGDGDSTEPDSIEDRWARIGVFPTGTDKPPRGPARNADRTVSLRTDAPRDARPPAVRETDGAPAARDGRTPVPGARDTDRPAPLHEQRTAALLRKEPVDDPRGERADGPAVSRTDREHAPRDADRTAALLRTEPEHAPREADRTAALLGKEPVDAPRGERADGPASSRAERADAPRGDGSRDLGRASAAVREEAADGARDVERTTVLRGPGAGAKSPWPASPVNVAAGALVRDPWREEPAGEAVAVTHDPHEVTVQLDAVQFGEGGVLRRAPAAPGRADGSDGPVFVDESGRRSRRYRRIGMAVGLVCAGYAVVIVATLLSGKSDAPWLPVPGQQQEQKPAGKVETTPRPGETESTPGAGTSLLPGGSPSAGASTLPEPGADVPGPGATAGQDRTGATADPEPTRTRKTQQPGTGTDDAPTSQAPAQTPTTPPADPLPTVEDPAPETTAPTDGGAGGTDVTGADTVADAPAAAQPVAAESPAAGPGPSATPASPEYVL